jgi:hypothetical protein
VLATQSVSCVVLRGPDVAFFAECCSNAARDAASVAFSPHDSSSRWALVDSGRLRETPAAISPPRLTDAAVSYDCKAGRGHCGPGQPVGDWPDAKIFGAQRAGKAIAMDIDRWAFVARRPRHQAGSDELAIQLLRDSGRAPRAVAAALVDFSRQGARLTVGDPLDLAETVILQWQTRGTGLDLHLTGAVRWQAPQADGWLVGCQFHEEVSMETLGELFLRGILSHQPSSPSSE